MRRVSLVIFLLSALFGIRRASSFGPPPSARPTSQPTVPDHLKVLTFNILQGKAGIRRIAKLIDAQRPDIVFLQEVCRPACDRNGIDQAAFIARKLGGLHVVSATTLGFANKQTRDPAILSRLALRDARAIRGKHGGRIFGLLATLDTSGRPLHLLCVHTTSTTRLTVDDIIKSSKVRMAQITDLLAVVKGLDGDVIIAGDFNAADWMPEYHAITRQWTDFGLVTQASKLSYPSYRPKVRIDYVFGRGRFEAASYRVLDARVSDHRPVVAELRLREGPP